ncbi:hypothetical protein ZWY2020_013139 [Hordeum vulgare]|nr:hypothetical protein ZWY2020_013139 [Hordeum vulgare]
MDRKRKRASKTNGRGLARYFEVVGSGSSSNPNPSTHESRNATTSLEATAHSVHQNQAHVERVTDPVEGDNANFTVEENVDSGLEGLMNFSISGLTSFFTAPFNRVSPRTVMRVKKVQRRRQVSV